MGRYRKPDPYSITGKNVNLWIRSENFETYKMIENKSRFFQIALDEAVGIMTWALLKKKDPKKYYDTHRPLEEVASEFNDWFPAERMTKIRMEKAKEKERVDKEKWHKTSAPKQDLW
jgi:hypothetical protein